LKQEYSIKPCISCSKEFKPFSSAHIYCCEKCKGVYKYKIKLVTTDSQYANISGNWRRYLQRLLYSAGRKDLTLEDLVTLLEKQEYKCALTGELLTCTLGRGMIYMTNASIDRIIPGGEYEMNNIRLVCRIANVMKWNMSDDELKTWCRRILDGPTK